MPSLSEKLDDDDVLRLGELPMVPFTEALLDRYPRGVSSADICETWHEFHPEQPIPKAEFKRVRDAWKANRTTIGSAAEEQNERADQLGDALDAALAQLSAAAATGNTKKLAELTKTIKGLGSLAPERAADRGTENWELLTDSERACMLALIAKLNGAPLDEDGEWFVALLSRVPAPRYDVHPAHIHLPMADRPAMLTP